MAGNDMVLKFENNQPENLIIIIDPPCEDFTLQEGQILYLKIVDYKLTDQDISEIVDIRYSKNNCINVDINYNLKLVVVFNDVERLIWDI